MQLYTLLVGLFTPNDCVGDWIPLSTNCDCSDALELRRLLLGDCELCLLLLIDCETVEFFLLLLADWESAGLFRLLLRGDGGTAKLCLLLLADSVVAELHLLLLRDGGRVELFLLPLGNCVTAELRLLLLADCDVLSTCDTRLLLPADCDTDLAIFEAFFPPPPPSVRPTLSKSRSIESAYSFLCSALASSRRNSRELCRPKVWLLMFNISLVRGSLLWLEVACRAAGCKVALRCLGEGGWAVRRVVVECLLPWPGSVDILNKSKLHTIWLFHMHSYIATINSNYTKTKSIQSLCFKLTR